MMLIYTNQLIAAKYLYDPFGNILSASGPLANLNIYRFASKEWNRSAGLYYFVRRYYDPLLQRFINRDPFAEQGGINLYAYVANNPINNIDPLGLFDCAAAAAAIARQESFLNGALHSMSDINQMSDDAEDWNRWAFGAYFLEVFPAGYSLAENAAATAATRFSAGGVDYVVSATGLVRARGTSTFYYTLRRAAQAREAGAITTAAETVGSIQGKEWASQAGESWSPMINANPIQGLANARNEIAQSMSSDTYQTIQLLQSQLANMMDMYRQNCPCK